MTAADLVVVAHDILRLKRESCRNIDMYLGFKIPATYYQMLKSTNFVFNCSVPSWVILFSFAGLTYEIFASLYP
jgi:hypothetical protein